MSEECHDVPQAVITMRWILSSSSSLMLRPPKRTVPSSSSNRPRRVFCTLSGCSMISFSMKCAKPPRSIVPRSQSTWVTAFSFSTVWRSRMR